MYRYRMIQRLKIFSYIALIALSVLLIISFFRSLFFNPEKEALRAVETFYELETAGNFGESWEMFHPLMKEKFSRNHYIQDRAHVFLNHFGVETFAVSFGKPKHYPEWQMDQSSPLLEDVYKIPIIMTFKGKYGDFAIHQDVFCHKVDGEWTILWSYDW